MLKASFSLTFTQIGLITLSYQLTASLLQPFVGIVHRPQAKALLPRRRDGADARRTGVPFPRAGSYPMILFSSVLVGMGSSIFHPEASRVAHMAAGERHGFAQSLFQVGGNLGTSFGPLLAALIIVPNGQSSILWFTLLALAGHRRCCTRVGGWYGHNVAHFHRRAAAHAAPGAARAARWSCRSRS